jgi:hypothetical protein
VGLDEEGETPGSAECDRAKIDDHVARLVPDGVHEGDPKLPVVEKVDLTAHSQHDDGAVRKV